MPICVQCGHPGDSPPFFQQGGWRRIPRFKNDVSFDKCYKLPWFCSDHCKMHYDRDEFHGDEVLWLREQVDG